MTAFFDASARITDDGVREIARRLNAGESGHAISRAMGVKQGRLWMTISRLQKVLGIVPTSQIWAEQRIEMLRRYNLGETNEQIAAGMHLSVSAVSQRILKMLGRVTLPPLPLSDLERADVERRLRLGESALAVARAVGCSVEAVKKCITPEVIAHLRATNPVCVCGKRAGHPGNCRVHGPVAETLKQRIMAGELIAIVAKDLGLTFAPANLIGRPLVNDLRAAGHRCPCGGVLSHMHACSAFPRRNSKVQYVGLADRVAEGLARGMTRAEIARAENVTSSTVIRLAAPMLAAAAEAGALCGCGRPVDHRGGCASRQGRRRTKPLHKGAALGITQYQRRRAAFHARRGRSDADIAERVGISEEAVRAVVSALVAVGQTMGGCSCGLPRNHAEACRGTTSPERARPEFVSGLAPAVLATVRRMYRSGLSIPEIARRADVAVGTIRRHVRHWVSNDLKVRTCGCGRPARHAGGCYGHHPRSLTLRWRRHVHDLILQGRTTREIADLYSLSFNSVLPHTRSARAQLAAEGRTCACGKEVGHQGVCWATYEASARARGPQAISMRTVGLITAKLAAGWRDEQIRAEFSVSQKTISRVRAGLNEVDRRRRSEALALTDDTLFARIEAVLPKRMRNENRDAVTSDLFFGVRTGTIDGRNLAAAAKLIMQRSFFATKYGPGSMDAPDQVYGIRTLHDRAGDSTAEAAVDEIWIGRSPP